MEQGPQRRRIFYQFSRDRVRRNEAEFRPDFCRLRAHLLELNLSMNKGGSGMNNTIYVADHTNGMSQYLRVATPRYLKNDSILPLAAPSRFARQYP
jgi:hypothetical protein